MTIEREYPLGIPEIAVLLGLSKSTINNYRSTGRFPPEDGVVGGSTPYWWPSTVRDWQRNRPGKGAGAGRKPKNRTPGQ
ncbi:MAG: helix-turn-helix domain-containing protein [Propionibacteriaceae bacterium]|nr:helix-turn-helix domain-containing protein [Propionibacteriaceae bacterium]